jgi:magnesium transporter
MRRAVGPLSGPLRMLAERPMRLIAPDIREYFRDVDDHLSRVDEQIAAFDELLTTIVQANLAQVTVEQNEDMRKISAWVAILAVPTAVAGIYGMNFDHMPELHWQYGYPLVVLVTLMLCLALHRGFHRNGWL